MDAVTLALIKSMAKGGGGGSLPPVTPADNGRVLKADYGEPDNISFRPNLPAAVAIEVNAQTLQYSGSPLTSEEIEHVMNDGGLTVNLMSGATEVGVMFARVASVDEYNTDDIVLDTGLGYAFDVDMRLVVRIDTSTGGVAVFDNSGDNFVIALTPTSLDMSGTMSKTPQEITSAYYESKKIVFSISTLGLEVEAEATQFAFGENISAGAYIIYNDSLIMVRTSSTDDDATYSATIYSLTPAS